MNETDTGLKRYLKQIGRISLLTPQQEVELAAKIKKGDAKAREQMINSNLRLVVKIAHDYADLGLPLLDLISEGNIGLTKAVERFDPTKGAKLSTYAAWWIKQAIKRALANLIDNAAEAMQDSRVREIHITTALLEGRDGLEIMIADTGHGINREVKEKLFLPYFSTKKRGTGLGLAIVRRIIEDHHGTIRVEENKPAGAKFLVELPLASEIAATESQSA